MNPNVRGDRLSWLVIVAGIAIVGVAIARAAFINHLATNQAGGPGGRDDLPRAVT